MASGGTREMISLVRSGLIDGWDRLIAAVKEALRLGVTDTAAITHILKRCGAFFILSLAIYLEPG